MIPALIVYIYYTAGGFCPKFRCHSHLILEACQVNSVTDDTLKKPLKLLFQKFAVLHIMAIEIILAGSHLAKSLRLGNIPKIVSSYVCMHVCAYPLSF